MRITQTSLNSAAISFPTSSTCLLSTQLATAGRSDRARIARTGTAGAVAPHRRIPGRSPATRAPRDRRLRDRTPEIELAKARRDRLGLVLPGLGGEQQFFETSAEVLVQLVRKTATVLGDRLLTDLRRGAERDRARGAELVGRHRLDACPVLRDQTVGGVAESGGAARARRVQVARQDLAAAARDRFPELHAGAKELGGGIAGIEELQARGLRRRPLLGFRWCAERRRLETMMELASDPGATRPRHPRGGTEDGRSDGR